MKSFFRSAAVVAGLGLAAAAHAGTVTHVFVKDSVAHPVAIPSSLSLGDTFAAASTQTTFYDFFQIYLPTSSKDSWSFTALASAGRPGLASLSSNLYKGQISTVAGLASATLVEAGTPKSGSTPIPFVGSTGKLVNLAAGWYTLEVTGKTLTKAGGASLGGSFGGTLTISPIPEPDSYAMLLAGLGVMGAVARRRKQK